MDHGKKNNQQQQKQIKQKSTKKPPKIKYLLASKKTWIIIYLTVYSTNWTVHVSWAGAKWRLGGGGILLCRCDKSCHHNCLIFWARAFPVTLFGNSSSKRYNYILIHQVWNLWIWLCFRCTCTWCKRITHVRIKPSLKQLQLDHTAKRAMLLSVVSSSLDKLRLQLFYNISFYQKYLMRVLFFLLCNFKNLPTNTHSKIIKWSQQSIIFISMWTLFNPCFAFFTLEDIQLGIFQYMSQCYTIVTFLYIYKKSKLKKR